MKILTFDIEDWFHILDNPSTSKPENWSNFTSRFEQSLDFILDALEKNNQKATFFILGWMAQKYPKQIQRISDKGYHLGTHSFAHQLVYQQKKNAFEEDLKKSIFELENLTGRKIDAYRAPGFSIKEGQVWALEKLIEYGIRYDSSIFPAARGHGGFKSFPVSSPAIIQLNNGELFEFPLNSKLFFNKKIIFSGGGYFRLVPLPILKRWFKNSGYVMTYFHPRDFDPDQPMLQDLSAIRKFKSYYGLAGAKNKLTSLLQHNNFMDIQEAASQLDATSIAKVPLKQ